MSNKVLVVSLLAAVAALACTEGIGPAFDSEAPRAAVVPDGALHHVRWAASDAPRTFTVEGAARAGDVLLAVSSDPAGSAGGFELDTYLVSFWAVRGQDRYVQINYVDEIDGQTVISPYLRFEVPRESLDEWPNGEEFESGDSVLITITVDPTDMVAHYEPSGLRFDEPALLQVWYGGADDDFDSDGDVDARDDYIERELLNVWYQQEVGGDWHQMSASHSLSEQWFKARLRHFSGYAVSWQE